jgi:proteasome lid subunit RPN8/RPN11
VVSNDAMDDLAAIDWSTVTRSESLAALYGWTGAGVIATAEPTDEQPGLVLVPRLWERLQAFGLTEKPRECCGVGIGPAGEVREFIPVENVADEPITRYVIAPEDQLRIHKRAAAEGWDVTLVFHTHPATDPVPSVTDRTLAAWPDAVYAILGLGGSQPDLRAWRIRGGVDGEVVQLDVSFASN